MLCEGLVDLFSGIASQKRRVGVYTPKKFVTRLKRENGTCRNIVNLLPASPIPMNNVGLTKLLISNELYCSQLTKFRPGID